MSGNNMYKIFKISAYNIPKSEYSSHMYENDIDHILKRLRKDKSYHLKIDSTKPCKFYGDFDHCESPEIFVKFLTKLSNILDVDVQSISFTESKNNNGEFSYHYVIPSIETTPTDIKYFFDTKYKTEFAKYKNKANAKSNNLDTSVYNNILFRLPGQTNENKHNPHEIARGVMKDFIIEYVDECEFTVKFNDNINMVQVSNEKDDDEVDMEHYEICLKCIDTYDDYQQWIQVGMALKNKMPDAEGLELWSEWSEQSDKFDKSECIKKWNSFKSDGSLGLGTLIMMAKECNREQYNQLYKELKDERKVEATGYKPDINFYDLSTASIAEHFKLKFSDKFIYQNEICYCFNGVYWQREDKKNLYSLNNFVSGSYFDGLFTELHMFEVSELKKASSAEDKETVIKKFNGIRGQLSSLKNYDRRQKYISDILMKLNNDDIKFDENPYLFAFNNKIYDLEQNKFIEPNAKQYISLTTGYNWIENVDESANIKEVNKLIDTIFPDVEIKRLYLTILATGLDGKACEKFVVANGTGGNGKGLLHEFVFSLLGNYAYILPSDVLMRPIKGDGVNVQIANMDRKRLIVAREPDSKYKINASTIKEITGGGEVNARSLYSKTTKTQLNSTFVMECNDKPKFDEANDAIARRLLDVPFKNKFVDEHMYAELKEEEKQYTFLTNPYYKTNEFHQKYRQALFEILCNHYKEFVNNSRVFPIPKEIMKRNKEYLQKSDDILTWFEENYVKTEDKKDVIKLKNIFDKFKTSEYYNNLTKQQKRDTNYKSFVEKMESNLFLRKFVTTDKNHVNIITNYVLKPIEDDDDEANKNDLDF